MSHSSSMDLQRETCRKRGPPNSPEGLGSRRFSSPAEGPSRGNATVITTREEPDLIFGAQPGFFKCFEAFTSPGKMSYQQQQQCKLPCPPPPQVLEPCPPKVPEPCPPKVPEHCPPKVPVPCPAPSSQQKCPPVQHPPCQQECLPKQK
ncbi:cornifin alpha-like [Heterocephalus glaber]|uniref:Cornifin alpha-like n=1 Tax=Heterocephalus glaber TaxID=10181 RepID=A0AAX6SAA2_HETGA|nr:cornifin alpha-like [Heterocephalus glaber]